MTIEATIPGQPIAQARARSFGFKRRDGSIGVKVYDEGRSRNWKAMAHDHLQRAMGDRQPFAGPVRLDVVAYFTCPKSDWKTRTPRPRRFHDKKPDCENVGKIILDSCSGIIFFDDRQVSVLTIQKVIAAQGEAPRVELRVTALEPLVAEPVRMPEMDGQLPLLEGMG